MNHKTLNMHTDWTEKELELLEGRMDTAQAENLIDQAYACTRNAYVPYSHFPVGAAILMKDGTIVRGCNVENASYPLGMCAERSAMFAAAAQGYGKQDMQGIVCAAPTDLPTTPCGACRQVMAELLEADTPVILACRQGHAVLQVSDLLPYVFQLNQAAE